MPSKEYFSNLAQMSRRIALNMTDPAIARRLEAIGVDFEQQAAVASDADPSGSLAPPSRGGLHDNERT